MHQTELTVTLHWEHEDRPQEGTATFADTTPAELIPLLLEGCALPAVTRDGKPIMYELRHGAARRPPLAPDRALSAQGVQNGSHLWLHTTTARPVLLRCLLGLPDGTELVISPRGQALTRSWLLSLLHMLHPEEYARQEAAGAASPYCAVSNSRPHCAIRYVEGQGWVVAVNRADVGTLLNGRPLDANTTTPLADGDQLTLGDADGLTLQVTVLQGNA